MESIGETLLTWGTLYASQPTDRRDGHLAAYAARLVEPLTAAMAPTIGTALAEECARNIAMAVAGGEDVRDVATECIAHRRKHVELGWPALSAGDALAMMGRVRDAIGRVR